jgi:hypothetical protein
VGWARCPRGLERGRALHRGPSSKCQRRVTPGRRRRPATDMISSCHPRPLPQLAQSRVRRTNLHIGAASLGRLHTVLPEQRLSARGPRLTGATERRGRTCRLSGRCPDG